jgi:hypothetical protein
MCFAIIVILFRGFFASSSPVVRPETPALRFISHDHGVYRRTTYPIITMFVSAIFQVSEFYSIERISVI